MDHEQFVTSKYISADDTLIKGSQVYVVKAVERGVNDKNEEVTTGVWLRNISTGGNLVLEPAEFDSQEFELVRQ